MNHKKKFSLALISSAFFTSTIALGVGGFVSYHHQSPTLDSFDLKTTNPLQGQTFNLSLVTNDYVTANNYRLVIPEGVTKLTGSLNPGLGIHKLSLSSTLSQIDSNPFVNCDNIFDVYVPSSNPTFRFQNGLLINTKTQTLVSSFENILGTTLVIPSGVTKINDQVFYANSQLSQLIVPVQVTKIGDQAFGLCPNLTMIQLPQPFASQSNLGLSADQLSLVGWLNPSNNQENYAFDLSQVSRFCQFVVDDTLTIPSSYSMMKGKLDPSLEIHQVVFASNSLITTIPDESFRNCHFLTSVQLPSKIQQIGAYAFSGCQALQSVNVLTKLTPSLTYLGQNAFNQCPSLVDIVLPQALNQPNLNNPNQNNYGFSLYQWNHIQWDNQLVTQSFDLGTITKYHPYLSGTTLTIPATVTHLEGSLNPDLKIKTINFASGSQITSLPDQAFLYCENLEQVNLPNSIVKIGDSVFQHCLNLTHINLNNQIQSIGNYAFSHCTSLESLQIPTSLTSLGAGCFEFDGRLNNLSFPASITRIQANTFAMCSSLTNLRFANRDGLQTVGSYAFYNTKVKSLTLNNNMDSIPDYAFSGMEGLVNLNLPTSLVSIGKYAFSDCKQLDHLSIPASLVSLGVAAFNNCTSLSSLTLPTNITTIPDNAFFNCFSLANLVCQAPINQVGNYAFSGCHRLTSFAFTQNLVQVGNGAFKNCQSLTSASILNSMTSFGDHVFEGCSKLVNVTIDNCVCNLGNYTFKDCSSLQEIALPSSINSLGDYLFSGCSSFYNLHYQDQPSNPTKTLVLPAEILCYGTNVFENCQGFDTVTFNSCQLNTIPVGCFHNCDRLTTINLPSNITQIGPHAFENCDGVLRIQTTNQPDSNVPAGWASIGGPISSIQPNAFANCQGLVNLEIGPNVLDFGTEAFLGASNLRQVKIDANPFLSTSVNFGTNLFNKGDVFANNLVIEFQKNTIRARFLQASTNGLNNAKTNAYYYRELNDNAGLTNMNNCLVQTQLINCSTLTVNDLQDGVLVVQPYIQSWIGNFTQIKPQLKGIVMKSTAINRLADNMFQNDQYLESVEINESSSITEIPYRFCDTCHALKTITLSSKITKIGEAGFLGCANGAVITFNNPNPVQLVTNVFKYVNIYPRYATFRFTTIAARDGFLNSDGNSSYFQADGNAPQSDGYYHVITRPEKNN